VPLCLVNGAREVFAAVNDEIVNEQLQIIADLEGFISEGRADRSGQKQQAKQAGHQRWGSR
jgi:hypothetical protein